MTIVDWINTALVVLSILATIGSLIVAMIKAKKSGKTINMLALIEKIPSLVTVAETIFGKGNGVAKLQYVVTQLKMIAMQNGIIVEDEELTRQVNNVVLATKYVNVGGSSNDKQPKQETPVDTVHVAEQDANNSQVVKNDASDSEIFGE